MSFTYHWPNHTTELHRTLDAKRKFAGRDKRQTPLDYHEKIGSILPPISLQADVLYPNAYASICNDNDDENVSVCPGCKGHQVDEEFPLIPRTPTAIPLVQYREVCDAASCDMCRVPVLNWENYIYEFNKSLRTPFYSCSNDRRQLPARKMKGQTPAESEGEQSEGPSQSTKRQLVSDAAVGEEILIPKFRDANKPLPPSVLRKYLNVPDLKVEGTWNFYYNHGGACDWVQSQGHRGDRTLLVGKGSLLRAVKIVETDRFSSASFRVKDVFDEDVPRQESKKVGFEEQIFQVIAHKKAGIAAARRGNEIRIYDVEDQPQLLTTIPRFGYSRSKKYLEEHPRDSMFSACDFTPGSPAQVATLNDNYDLQVHDFTAKKTVNKINLRNPNLEIQEEEKDMTKFTLNKSCGLQYVGDSSDVLYCYIKDKIYVYDRRENLQICGIQQEPELYTLMDLKGDKCAQAIADQRYYSSESDYNLLEYISCLQRSQRSNYFYVGSSHRLFLMDWRVPKHPVVNLSHGMQSPAAFIDVVPSDNFETVVAGSQRKSETFCAVLDYAHVSCEGRTECKARNPILLSYPRHLSSSNKFYDVAMEDGFQMAWEDDSEAVHERCNAWCTGIAAGQLPVSSEDYSKQLPPGIFVVTTNAYGDIFYQEWTQRTDTRLEITHRRDSKWKNFLGQWQDSMKMKKLDSGVRPSTNQLQPEDCTLFIEPVGAKVQKLTKVRTQPFDATSVDIVECEKAEEQTTKLEENCERLKNFRGDRVLPFLKVWEDEWHGSDDSRAHHSGLSAMESTDRRLGLETTEEATMLVEPALESLPLEIKQEPEDIYGDYGSDVLPLEVEETADTAVETVTIDVNNLFGREDNVVGGLNYSSFENPAMDFLSSTHVGGLSGFGHSIFDTQGTSFSSFFEEQNNFPENSFSQQSTASWAEPHVGSSSGQAHYSQTSTSSAKRAGF